MTTDAARLGEANACHDDDPARGAELLRAIAPAELPADRWPGYAFLLNHVLGEKLSCWPEALSLQRHLLALAQPSPAAVLWRHAATAARVVEALLPAPTPQEVLALGASSVTGAAPPSRSTPAAPAGNQSTDPWTAGADDLATAFAHASGAGLEHCIAVLNIGAAMHRAPAQTAALAATSLLDAFAPLASPAWHASTPVDTTVASCANNIAGELMERPEADLLQPALRAALAQSAEVALRFWQRAGTWVHQERAWYLRAMVGHALGQPQDARGHALAALALLDANDGDHAEDVDRAFIELERWFACERLGLDAEATLARDNAHSLSGRFDDPGLASWFAGRLEKLRALSHR